MDKRLLFTGLVTANVCLGLWLSATTAEQPPLPEPALAALDAEEIQLIAEVGTPVGTPIVEAPKPPARECRIWGPEPAAEAFEDLRARLDAIGGFPEVQAMEVRAAPDYLVYVTNLGSRDNAKRVARELEALDIESYAMTADSGAPILSVGLFSRENLALKQRDRVTELGYDVTLERLERTQTVYNLVAHVSVDAEDYPTSTSSCVAIAQSK